MLNHLQSKSCCLEAVALATFNTGLLSATEANSAKVLDHLSEPLGQSLASEGLACESCGHFTKRLPRMVDSTLGTTPYNEPSRIVLHRLLEAEVAVRNDGSTPRKRP